jgi:hypothetical protein
MALFGWCSLFATKTYAEFSPLSALRILSFVVFATLSSAMQEVSEGVVARVISPRLEISTVAP